MITIGVDLGGTNLRAAAVDSNGRILSCTRLPVEDRSPQAILEVIEECVAVIAGNFKTRKCSNISLCIALAGQIRLDSGVVARGPNLGWFDVPFKDMLNKVFSFPVSLVNDLSAASWGECLAGAGKGTESMVLVAVGSGVGSGIIENGQLVDGACGLAGELGHIKVVIDGDPCGCGEKGCLEAYAGGHRMAARALRLWSEPGNQIPPEVDPSSFSTKDLWDLFQQGDTIAKRVLQEAGDHLGLAAANLVTILNPKKLILGGGVLLGVPYLVDRIRDTIQTQSAAPARADVSIEIATLGDNAGLIGAGLLAGLNTTNAEPTMVQGKVDRPFED